jgi:hypothetical protein
VRNHDGNADGDHERRALELEGRWMALEIILITVAVVAFLAATPLFSVDSSDARSESARPAAGWWPAGPDAR